jgi:protein Tex
VHPEAYPVVRRILATAGTGMPELIGNTMALRALRPADFTDERFGLPTVTDILRELEKPGRDPRPAFTTASFAEGVETLADLAPGMILEGVVTNVAAFGAFVDIGVHQDGLVHVSAMSRNFVSDPREVAKSGDVVRVKVLGVDEARKRISLTLRLDDEPGDGSRPARGAGGPAGSEAARPGAAGAGAARPGAAGAGERPAAGGRPGDGTGRPGGGGGRPGGGSGRPGGGRAGGGRGDDGGGAGNGGGAMAEALRRAGLAGETGDRRGGRPGR